MTSTLRAVHYAFHEDNVRDRCNLPRVIDAYDWRELDSMAGEVVARSGSYEARNEEIRQRAKVSLRHPVSMGQSEAGSVGQSH